VYNYTVINFIATLFYILLTTGGLVAIKIGTSANEHVLKISERLSIPFNISIISGVLMYGLSFLVYIYLISKFELSYIIPVTAAVIYILVFVASFTIFHESISWMKIIGIILIVSGLVVLNAGK
jgi:small multidrug resistance pump